jgi:hypothetical protein
MGFFTLAALWIGSNGSTAVWAILLTLRGLADDGPTQLKNCPAWVHQVRAPIRERLDERLETCVPHDHAAGAAGGRTLSASGDKAIFGVVVSTQLRRRRSRGGGVNRGVADPERAAPDATNTTPENQAATSHDQDRVWPVRVIRRGDAVRPLPLHARSLEDLTFEVGDVRLSLSDYMARRRHGQAPDPQGR